MKTIERFLINKNSYIDILVPIEKFNYYYESTKELNKFDEVMVLFKGEEYTVELGSEMIDMVIESLYDSCLRVLEGKAILPPFVKVGTLGYNYNIITKNEGVSATYLDFFVWSGRLVPTFLYEKDGKIYLEISPLYPWLFEKPKKNQKFEQFETFLKSYKSILVEIPDKKIIEEWLSQCQKITNTIEVNHERRIKDKH